MATATARGATGAAEYPTRMFIDGSWCDALDGKTLAVINPADESVLAEVAYGTRTEADRAIAAAERAFPAWRALSAYDRAKILKKTADLMRERVDRIARTLTQEQGKPLTEARLEVLHAADTFEWFAEEGKRAYGRIIPPTNVAKRHYAIKHPVGVVGTITPWNFPAALPSRKIAPALAVGCTVVSRPADQTPLTLIQMFECLADAGIPPGVANLVIGPARPIADAFFEHPVSPQDQLHRLDRGRQGADPPFGRPGQASEPRAWRPRAADRLPRRRRSPGGPGGGDRQVPQQWPGLHRPVALLCPREDLQGLHRRRGRAGQQPEARQRPGTRGSGRPDVRGPGAREDLGARSRTPAAKGGKVLTGGGRSNRFDKGYWFEPTVIREVNGRNEAHDRGAIRTGHAAARFR